MESLSIGTTVYRSFDDRTYVKETYSDDLKRPCIWRHLSSQFPLFLSDTSVQTNTKQFSNIVKP